MSEVEKTLTQKYHAELRQKLTDYFSETDLRNLCYDMAVDYESLPGEGKANKAREFITYLERHGCISELVQKSSELRPNVNWNAEANNLGLEKGIQPNLMSKQNEFHPLSPSAIVSGVVIAVVGGLILLFIQNRLFVSTNSSVTATPTAASSVKISTVTQAAFSASNAPTATPTSVPTAPPATATATSAPTAPPATPPVPASPTAMALCRKWDLASDFRIWPKQENPNRDSCDHSDTWHFMSGTSLNRNPNSYSLLPEFISDSYGIIGLLRWQNLNAQDAGIGFNATGIKQQYKSMTWPAGAIMVHPDSSKLMVIGWRSPVSGKVKITGSVVDAEPGGDDGINWYINKGSTDLAAGTCDDGGAQDFQNGMNGDSLSKISVNEGEFIYLAIHPKESYRRDPTLVNFTISY